MTLAGFVDQTILHAEGEVGNCFQAAIASVIGWPLDAVPHFALLGEDHWWDCAQAWLDQQGFLMEYQSDTFKEQSITPMPRCILSGPSPRGFSHAVVGDSATGGILHDPHPSRAGLVEVVYRVSFFQRDRRA